MDRPTCSKAARFTNILLLAVCVALAVGRWTERRSYRLERDSLSQQLKTLETQNSHAASQLATLREQLRGKTEPEAPSATTEATAAEVQN
jgi:hypothetical protein